MPSKASVPNKRATWRTSPTMEALGTLMSASHRTS